MQMGEISMQDTKKKLSDISPPADTLDNLPRRNTESSRMNAAQILKNTGLPPTKTPRQMFYDLYAQKIELKIQSEELQRMQARLKKNEEKQKIPYDPDSSWLKKAELEGFTRHKAVRNYSPSTICLIVTDSSEVASVLDALRLDADEGRHTSCDIRGLLFSNRHYSETQNLPEQLIRQNQQVVEEKVWSRPAEEPPRENEKCYRMALDASSNGLWDLNLLTGEVSFGENWYRTLGYKKPGAYLDNQAWQNLIHPDDRDRVLAMRKAHVQGMTDRYEVEYRIKNVAGEWLWIVSRGSIVARDKGGKALRMIGTYTDITRRIQAEAELKSVHLEYEQRMKERTTELYETNIALEVLLKKREEDKKALEGYVMANIEKLVEPFLTRLEKSRLTEQQQALVGILRNNIEELTSPFAENFTAKLTRLTPVEIQVANLVKRGKSTKEIAQIMHLSAGTISIHRKNIRKKLDLTHQKTNLQSILTTNFEFHG